MSNKPLLDSQKKIALEKAIRSHSMSADQQIIIEYLRLRFSNVLTKWMAGADQANPERLRGEAACLKELIKILSNAQVELLEGDN